MSGDTIREAQEALERAEKFVAEIERKDIDPETGEPNFQHAPAIATARAALVGEAAALREALREIAELAEWYSRVHAGPEREVHHALKVEVLDIAERALAGVSPAQPAEEQR